jgi:3-oxoacyl-[acyl-carrier protein] reductase
MTFQDQVAVVTGAAGGMGAAIAKALLAEGAYVLAIDVKKRPDVSWLDTDRANYAQVDLKDYASVEASVADAAKVWGRIDHLVNAAGVLWLDDDKSVLEIDLSVWDAVLDINLKSMAHAIRAVVPHMSMGGAMFER